MLSHANGKHALATSVTDVNENDPLLESNFAVKTSCRVSLSSFSRSLLLRFFEVTARGSLDATFRLLSVVGERITRESKDGSDCIVCHHGLLRVWVLMKILGKRDLGKGELSGGQGRDLEDVTRRSKAENCSLVLALSLSNLKAGS